MVGFGATDGRKSRRCDQDADEARGELAACGPPVCRCAVRLVVLLSDAAGIEQMHNASRATRRLLAHGSGDASTHIEKPFLGRFDRASP